MTRHTHESFRKSETYRGLSQRNLRISYHDNTHLTANEWIPLLDVEVLGATPSALNEDGERYYTVTCSVPTTGNISDDNRRVLLDTLSLSLSRAGLIAPPLGKNSYIEIEKLSHRAGIVLVPDTNALFNGTLHWLLRIFHHTHVWILPFVVSITQLQQREARLKSLVNKRSRTNLIQALRSRAFVNGTMGLLERYREQYQVLELDPSLLRYMRPAGRGTVDPDEGDVLEDRLLVEGIHAVFKSTRTRAMQRVVTSDTLLARVLHAEGIPTLFMPVPKIGDEAIHCIHYSPIARSFCGAPLSAVLWDLAHTFSAIRVSAGTNRQFQLEAYWADKIAGDWQDELLSIEVPEQLISAGSEPEPEPSSPQSERARAPAVGTTQSRRAAPQGRRTPPIRPKLPPGVLTDAALPQASLPQVLRLAGAVSEGPGSLDDILARLPQRERPIAGTAKRGLEILRRVGVISADGTRIVATEKLAALEVALRSEMLDEISSIFTSFEPYSIVLKSLKEKGQLARSEVEGILRRTVNTTVGKEASERLLRFPILLGQGWVDGQLVLDGSQRPPAEEALRGLYIAFKRSSRHSLARVSDFLSAFCRDLRVSPWAAKRQIARLVADGQLRELSFQPAAGHKPIVHEHVISGTLQHPELTPVAIDRILIGGRPVFTVSGDLP
jgi:hypothetical protein